MHIHYRAENVGSLSPENNGHFQHALCKGYVASVIRALVRETQSEREKFNQKEQVSKNETRCCWRCFLETVGVEMVLCSHEERARVGRHWTVTLHDMAGTAVQHDWYVTAA